LLSFKPTHIHENHMRSIFDKLGVTTRTRLAVKLHEAAGKGSETPAKLS
jgi:hypothetical protein